METPRRLALADPTPFLAWLSARARGDLDLAAVDVAQVWALVASATLARDGEGDLHVRGGAGSPTERFAHAVGFDDLVAGRRPAVRGEQGRTIKLARFHRFEEVEPEAADISRLLVAEPDLEDTRRTLYYVLVELLRNAVQHSLDRKGGVVAAQRMDRGNGYGERPMIQIAVGDAGIGIPASLRDRHPKIASAREALEKALWPHISGAFEEGLSGTAQNAGLGLFFIAEMAKLTAGRLLVASRGAALYLAGDPEGTERHEIRFLGGDGTGFPGTLVAFELGVGEVKDYDALIATIARRARERSPARALHRWLRFDEPLAGVLWIVVEVAAEDTAAAERFARETLLVRLAERRPLALDFRGIQICTQSYLHALLYEPLRMAWALRVPIHALNVQSAVRSSLDLLESYALGG